MEPKNRLWEIFTEMDIGHMRRRELGRAASCVESPCGSSPVVNSAWTAEDTANVEEALNERESLRNSNAIR